MIMEQNRCCVSWSIPTHPQTCLLIAVDGADLLDCGSGLFAQINLEQRVRCLGLISDEQNENTCVHNDGLTHFVIQLSKLLD